MAMPEVFLSYSRADAEKAGALANFLEELQISVWWDRELMAGQSFATKLRDRLESASAVIVLWSTKSLESKFVEAESDFAALKGKYVPIALEANLSIPIDDRHTPILMWPSNHDVTAIGQQLLAVLAPLGIRPNSANAVAKPRSRRDAVRAKGYAFISHVEEDIPLVSTISGFLKKRSYAYWTYHESERDFQKPTHLEIEERLVGASLMLSVLSPEWKRSEWTFRELWFAREIRKPLFLLRFKSPGPTLAIAGDTYIDFERDSAEGFRRLGLELDKKGL